MKRFRKWVRMILSPRLLGAWFGVIAILGLGSRAPAQPEPPVMDLGNPITLFTDEDAKKEQMQIDGVAVAPDGKSVVVGVTRISSGVQPMLRAFELPSGKPLASWNGRPLGHVAGLAFSPDGKTLAVSVGAHAQICEYPSGKELAFFKSSRNYGLRLLKFSSDGKRLVGAVNANHVIAWDVATQAEIGYHKTGLNVYTIADLLVSADGREATVFPTFGGLVERIDLQSGKLLEKSKTAVIHCRTFAGEKRIYAFARASSIIAWDFIDGKETEVATLPRDPVRIAVSADGKTLAFGFQEGQVSVWDVPSRRELATVRAHERSSFWIALSPDGEKMVTGSGGGYEAKLWDLSRLPRPIVPDASPTLVAEKKSPPASNKDDVILAGKTRRILETHCYRCHGENGAAEGGLNFVLDRRRLVESKRVVPGAVAQSRLVKRVLSEEMPPEDEKVRPSAEEIATLRQWVVAGAPDWEPTKARATISIADVARRVREDRQRATAEQRDFFRYLTITPLYNAGQSEDELQTIRVAISKTINSVSMGERIVAPVAIDPARTILRIDLRDYKIAPLDWDGDVGGRHPYGVAYIGDHAQAPWDVPVRGDWFVHAASRPPVYHNLLGIPRTVQQLEGTLKVDTVKGPLPVRAGFNGSGISRNNRLIERHDAAHGYYWKSFDFAGNVGRQNLFSFPLGPGPGIKNFQHDGGEIIYRLPNGLQGYMLTDARGNRLNRAPSVIVSDPKHPERVVENGISCMSCHQRGLIAKTDQIRAHVEKNVGAFTPADLKSILALHPPSDKISELLKTDAESFALAAAKIGAKAGAEPIVSVSLRFEAELDLKQAAAELWCTPEKLVEGLENFPSLGKPLGALRTAGGTIQREVFIGHFHGLVVVLKIAEPVGPIVGPVVRDDLPTPPSRAVRVRRGDDYAAGAFEEGGYRANQRSVANPPVIDPTFQWIATYRDSNTVDVYDVAKSRLLATLKGHSGCTTAVFSPDGKRLAVAGRDGIVRIWNWIDEALVAETPKRSNPFHLSSIAFTPDGKLLAGTGFGHCEVQYWDPTTGSELTAVKGNLSTVGAVAVSPNGKSLVSVDNGRQRVAFAVWNAEAVAAAAVKKSPGNTLYPRSRLHTTDGELLGLAMSPDSKSFITTSGNGTIRVWDLATCDHVGADRLATSGRWQTVQGVAYSPDGKYVATAHEDGAMTIWQAATMRDLIVFHAHRPDTLRTVAFSPDGSRLASADLDGAIRFWDMRKILAAAKDIEEDR